ncbi:MAG: prephenate dehydrogenase [Gemmatimonadaceae bacterium]
MSGPVERVAIIGLGMIGGSLARDLSDRGVRVSGFDLDEPTLVAAREAGVVSDVLDDHDANDPAQIVVLAVPVTAAASVFQRFEKTCRRALLITDVGSTKVAVQGAAERAGLAETFVGTHPLTGDHRSGWQASRSGRFTGARVFLCAASTTRRPAIVLAESFWRTLGATTEFMTPEDHDGLLAWSSHLPQFVSCALATALFEAGVHRSELGPGGRDATRLAGSSPDVWTAIADDNRVRLGSALEAVESSLRAIRAAVQARDLERVRAYLEISQQWFDALPANPHVRTDG